MTAMSFLQRKLKRHAKKHFSYPKTHWYWSWISHLAQEEPAETSFKGLRH